MFDLKGRVAVVTGGNGGIGLGMAKGLGLAGARVAIAARNAEKSRAAVETLEGLGAEAIAVTVDVADEASVEAAIRSVVDRLGPRELMDLLRGVLAERVIAHIGHRRADDRKTRGQRALLGEVVQSGQELAAAEITGGSEYDHHGRIGDPVVVETLG